MNSSYVTAKHINVGDMIVYVDGDFDLVIFTKHNLSWDDATFHVLRASQDEAIMISWTTSWNREFKVIRV